MADLKRLVMALRVPRITGLAAATVVAGVLACAGASQAVPELVPDPVADRRSCTIEGDPGDLTALLDSARAAIELPRAGVHDGGVVISFATDSTGALTRFNVAQATVGPGAVDAIAAGLRSLIAEGGAPPSRSGRLLVRFAGGELTELRVGPYRGCRPVLTNSEEVESLLARIHAETGKVGTVDVRFRVDTVGVPMDATIQQGTGDVTFDLRTMSVVRAMRFRPALIDGQPVAVWVQLDVTVRVQQWCPPLSDSVGWSRLEPTSPCWDRQAAPLRWRS